jgi:Bacterial Ig-like domain (group 2)
MSNPISPIVPVNLSVSPTMIAINQSATLQLTPELTGSDGLPFSPTASFVYSSSYTALATVDDTGLVTAYTPADSNLLNEGGIVSITVTYPFSNRTDGETINAVSVIKVLANAARTQAILRTGDIIAGDSAYSRWVEYQVGSASAPPPIYPPNWVIPSN